MVQRKVPKKVEEKKIVSEITQEMVLKLAAEKGCIENNLSLIHDWIRDKFGLHAEIFYSLFHKKWSINNYFVNITRGERVPWDYTSKNYESHTDALIVALYHLLNKI